jgi:hypothetical protein
MSDFIMEQEVNTPAVDNDLEIMEGFMKLSAVGAIAETYCEHAAIAQFATEAGLNVFSESDDNIMKKAWNATKEFFSTIWEWLKGLVKGIVRFFTQSSVDRLIVKLEEMKKDNELNSKLLFGLEVGQLNVIELLDIVEDFGEAVKKGAEGFSDSGEGSLKDFKDKAEAWLKKGKDKDNWKTGKDEEAGGMRATVDDVLGVLREVSKANIPGRGSKLLKKFDFNKSNYKKKDGDNDVKDKDKIKEIKKAANLLAKAYDKYVDQTVSLVNKVLKKNLKKEDIKSANEWKDSQFKDINDNKTESYAENTDGYYFL